MVSILPNQREIYAPSSPKAKMKKWKPPKKEKLFRRKKLWTSTAQTSSSYDQGACDGQLLPKRVKYRKATVDSLYLDLEVQSSVMARAKEVEAKLSPNYPSLIKVMLPSHVAGPFLLGLPKEFCNCHLPKENTVIVLEDESGVKFETKYIFDRFGSLSAGWKGFSIAHKLVQGDVIVFHLVKPTKFMVYIVRSNGAVEVNGPHKSSKKQMPLSSCEERLVSNIEEEEPTIENVNSEEQDTIKKEEDENPDSLMMDNHEEPKQMSCQVVVDTAERMYTLDGSVNDNNDSRFNFMNGIQLSDSIPDFDNVMSSNDFSILVNGLVIDSELSPHIRTKYYELCCSQKSFLHEHLRKSLNYKLVSGIISETINIADDIRSSKITTSQECLTTWDKTLKAFEGLGMNVGFLRSRIDQLLSLSLKPEKKREVKLKRETILGEVSVLEMKLFEAREVVKQLEAEIHSLDIDIDYMELLFKEVASAPW